MATATAPTRVELASIAKRLKQATGAEQVWLFGSRARGDAQADSDVDILYVLPNEIDLYTASERAERALWPRRRPFDLVPMHAAHWIRQDSALARQVAREGIILDDT